MLFEIKFPREAALSLLRRILVKGIWMEYITTIGLWKTLGNQHLIMPFVLLRTK
ncbi:hypothetical protein TIA1EST1_06415 [Cutibacterium acnes hdn-1]|nr:hypothetical protein TIA1EST1_06415 [Cutibacterium acnes hdn-1]KEY34349.1 cystathionine beta-synthase [Cutibacterium acnes]